MDTVNSIIAAQVQTNAISGVSNWRDGFPCSAQRLQLTEHMNQPIRPKVLIASLTLLGPILLATHVVTHSFSSLVFASPAHSGAESPCSEMKAAVSQTQSWIELYEPLASRGGIYRKAYQENLTRNAAARKSLSTCSN